MKNKGRTAALTVSFGVMALVFSGCDILMGGVPQTEKPGVYRIVNGGEKEWMMIAGDVNLSNCLAQIRREALSGSGVDKYEIVLMRNEEINPKIISPLTDDYHYAGIGLSKTSFASKEITLKALNEKITIKQKKHKNPDDHDMPLLVIGTYEREAWESGANKGEVTFIVGSNITLEGFAGNPWPLIHVVAGGNLIIGDDAAIQGNERVLVKEISGNYGGAMEIFNGGTVVMNGGAITNNGISGSIYPSIGGGALLVSVDGKFTMNGGAISNNRVSNSYAQGVAAGGGIFGYESVLTLNGGTISENSVSCETGSAYGGGIYLQKGCTPVWKGGVISGNTLSGSSGPGFETKGGGIFVETRTALASPEMLALTIENNVPDPYYSPDSSGGGT
jgi:hypothetical protein